ncbi:hypothetical protein MHYP_G00200140 [Metynnis hypsauchen]
MSHKRQREVVMVELNQMFLNYAGRQGRQVQSCSQSSTWPLEEDQTAPGPHQQWQCFASEGIVGFGCAGSGRLISQEWIYAEGRHAGLPLSAPEEWLWLGAPRLSY